MKSTLKYLLYAAAALLPLSGTAASAQGSLTGTAAAFTSNVNLSAEGSADWAHWGLTSATDFNHKAGANQISNFTQIGTFPVYTVGDNVATFTWTDGTPTVSASGTNTGVFTGGFTTGIGFSFTAPADKSTRTLRVFVGGYNAGGTMTAHLSDSSAADYVDTSVSSTGTGNIDGQHFYAVYTFVYKANSANQTLNISWVDTTDTTPAGNQSFTNVSLEAATLVGGLITAPPAPTALTATAGQTDITLTWTGAAGATGYNVKRSTTAGGPYTTIASTTDTTYKDRFAPFGTTVYYVVSATNSVGESANSSAASAKITTSLIASDNAGDPVYANGLPNGTLDGLNGGTGFNPWIAPTSSTSGFFLYKSTDNGPRGGASIDSNGQSFGFYAYNGGNATATRNFNTPLTPGQIFLLDFDNGYIDNGGFQGFNLVDAAGNTRFGFAFAGGEATYNITDSTGTNATTLPYTPFGLTTGFTLTTATTYSFTATDLVTGTSITATGSLAGSGAVAGVSIYDNNGGGGGDHNMYANRLLVIAPGSGAAVTGKVVLQSDTAQTTQDITFTFVPTTGGGSAIVKTIRTTSDGSFSIAGIPAGTYNLGIKSAKNLRVTYTNVSVTASGATIPATTLLGGDATNDNIIDIGDFGVLVNAYGGDRAIAGSGYDAKADFNDDGIVDIGDFGILVNNYGTSGDAAP